MLSGLQREPDMGEMLGKNKTIFEYIDISIIYTYSKMLISLNIRNSTLKV